MKKYIAYIHPDINFEFAKNKILKHKDRFENVEFIQPNWNDLNMVMAITGCFNKEGFWNKEYCFIQEKSENKDVRFRTSKELNIFKD